MISELSLKGFKDFLEREKAPGPLTEAEEDKLEIKKAEANPDIGKKGSTPEARLGKFHRVHLR